jgi:transglutaminase-like putative cysteine protease
MEARMQPRSDGLQRCLHFSPTAAPAARVMMCQDHDGNAVHYFNIAARHSRLTLTADTLVECLPAKPVPHRVGPGAWTQLDAMAASGEWWEWLASARLRAPPPGSTPSPGRCLSNEATIRSSCSAAS